MKEIPKEFFPPSILKIMEGGLQDGRKRALFVLTNFLRSVNWEWEKIATELAEWNKKNRPPLADNYIRTQLRWHQRLKESLSPPNYDNAVFYKNIGIRPDDEEMKFKNPINYVLVKMQKPRKIK
jgi:hypothetical protein